MQWRVWCPCGGEELEELSPFPPCWTKTLQCLFQGSHTLWLMHFHNFSTILTNTLKQKTHSQRTVCPKELRITKILTIKMSITFKILLISMNFQGSLKVSFGVPWFSRCSRTLKIQVLKVSNSPNQNILKSTCTCKIQHFLYACNK